MEEKHGRRLEIGVKRRRECYRIQIDRGEGIGRGKERGSGRGKGR